MYDETDGPQSPEQQDQAPAGDPIAAGAEASAGAETTALPGTEQQESLDQGGEGGPE